MIFRCIAADQSRGDILTGKDKESARTTFEPYETAKRERPFNLAAMLCRTALALHRSLRWVPRRRPNGYAYR
jgi:hypothetical protein